MLLVALVAGVRPRAAACSSGSARSRAPATSTTSGRGGSVAGVGRAAVRARAAGRRARPRHARDALPRARGQLARAADRRACRRAGRCARCWPRASATAPSPSPTGCPTASASSTSTGARSSCPQPGSGRAWTAVDRDGQRVAAIIHDASLDTSPELVMAAAAASSLAIDNERLKADLQARVEELRLSRLRIIEAGDAARRRIERDLHDGAQQQLVSLALDLRMLKARLQGPGRSTSSRRAWRPRWPSCASSPAASIPRSSPTAAWRRRSSRWPTAASIPIETDVEVDGASRRRRSRPPPTSSSPRR